MKNRAEQMLDTEGRGQTPTGSDDPVGVRSFCRHPCNKKAASAREVRRPSFPKGNAGPSQPFCCRVVSAQRGTISAAKAPPALSVSPQDVPIADFPFVNSPG